MNFSGLAGSSHTNVEKSAFPTEPQRVGQVERTLQELDQAVAFLEKHTEQLFTRLKSVIPPIPAANGAGHGDKAAAVLCPVAERMQNSTDRIRNVVTALEAVANLVEL